MLKKGQKIKIDLAVDPPSEDFDGYVYRLRDYPDEYIKDDFIKIRIDLPITVYYDLAYTTVSSTADAVKLYDASGQLNGRSIASRDQKTIPVDGLFYIWNAASGKAELYYHYLNGSESSNTIINSDGSEVERPRFDSQTGQVIESDADKLMRTNSFIKASDVKYTRGLKLTPVNTPQEAQADQKIATTADKADLQKEFKQSQEASSKPSLVRFTDDYKNALVNASLVLRSNKSTVAQVKEATWLLKTTRTQMTTLNFPQSS